MLIFLETIWNKYYPHLGFICGWFSFGSFFNFIEGFFGTLGAICSALIALISLIKLIRKEKESYLNKKK